MADKKASVPGKKLSAWSTLNKLFFSRRRTSIRIRLLVYFVLLVALSAGTVGTVSAVLGWRDGKRQVTERLELTAGYRRTEIGTWVNGLVSELNTAWTANLSASYARELLQFVAYDQYLSDTLAEFYITNVERLLLPYARAPHQFSELSLLDVDGRVIATTNALQRGYIYSDTLYFQSGMQGASYVYLTPELVQQTQLIVAIPIFDVMPDDTSAAIDSQTTILGVLVGYANPTTLLELLSDRAGLGTIGEIYLVNTDYQALTELRDGQIGSNVRTAGVMTAIQTQGEVADVYTNYNNVNVIGVYAWLPKLQAVLVAEQEQRDAFRAVYVTVGVSIGITLLAVLLAAGVALLVTNGITDPLSRLANTATRIAAGDLEYALDKQLQFEVEHTDEIGTLAQAFFRMTLQLRELIDSLEQRVESRTRGLETVAEVSRATTSVLDPEQLLPQVVNLVQERFNLYYVGLFLVDESEKDVVLRAGTGEAGRQMMAEGWKLEVGGASMIGQCVATGQPGLKQRAGDIAVRFENPFLPETRSELALPLRYGQQIVGAMTVQSVYEAAFDDAYIALLQNLADQVAVAVENAELFAKTQAALERAQSVQQRYQGQAWESYLQSGQVRGYEWRGNTLLPLPKTLLPETKHVIQTRQMSVASQSLVVPIKQGDQILGVLGFEREDGQEGWSPEDVTLVQSLSEQLLLAAENQRLLDETQRNAARESVIREISDQMQRATNMEMLMRITAEELNRLLKGSRVYVHLDADAQRTGVDGQKVGKNDRDAK
ncbi:MAG: GAF domain-containing protein [Anaerolineae bacterium]|nr:GAF domain-containing protein [Anaerolineae bacterium]